MPDFSIPIREECTALSLLPSFLDDKEGRGEERESDRVPAVIAAFTDGSIRLFHAKNDKSSVLLGQIHGKGVHRALRMDLAVSEDGRWCFASALRGSMELIAIRMADRMENDDDTGEQRHFQTFSHVDAKLRGLGACTKINDQKYLLLTGKSIKNIHIWSFVPPSSAQNNEAPPLWQCLYDCPTNGNTIQWLHFRRDSLQNSNHHLQAISKSQGQKLRIWDLSHESSSFNSNTGAPSAEEEQERPARPPFLDVAHTECALGIAGDWAVCGGETFHNQISIVALNRSSNDPFNHTELALPNLPSTTGTSASAASSVNRRAQRGDLRSVIAMAGRPHLLLLELSDGTIAEYSGGALQLLPHLQAPMGAARQLAVGPGYTKNQAHLLVATHHHGRGSIVGMARDWCAPKANDPTTTTTSDVSCEAKTAATMTTTTTELPPLPLSAKRCHSETPSVPKKPLSIPESSCTETTGPTKETAGAVLPPSLSTKRRPSETPAVPKKPLSIPESSDTKTTAVLPPPQPPLSTKRLRPSETPSGVPKKKKPRRAVNIQTPSLKPVPPTTPFLHPHSTKKVTPDAPGIPPVPRSSPEPEGITPDPSPPVPRKRGSPLTNHIATPQFISTSSFLVEEESSRISPKTTVTTPRSAKTPAVVWDYAAACAQALRQLQRLDETTPHPPHKECSHMQRHHQAAHRRLRQRVLQAARSTIQSLGPTPQRAHFDLAQQYLAVALSHYQAIAVRGVCDGVA